ncbi:16514_t:CDS:1, partial [Cetraspora pellucida]
MKNHESNLNIKRDKANKCKKRKPAKAKRGKPAKAKRGTNKCKEDKDNKFEK